MNHELPDVQAGFRKGRGTRDQIDNICWIIEKAREFQTKTSTSALLTMPKPLIVWITKSWNILKKMGISDHITCLLRNLCAGQEGTVRTGQVIIDWFQVGKEVCQDCILSSCLFNLYAEYIMRNTRLDEAQAGIRIAGRNINNICALLQGTFRNEELNPFLLHLLHRRQLLYPLNHLGSPC